MKIVMVGSGYVGLVSGACFSEFGFNVCCVDKDPAKIALLEQGEIPIYEPGLQALVASNKMSGRLTFTTDLAREVATADVVFIAVGTPSRRGDGHADLTFVFQAAEEIAKALKDYTLVVTKSTVPVGTGRKIAEIIKTANPAADFDVASNPEFLREGSAIEDFMRPDRVVAGVESERARQLVTQLYRPLYLNETPIVFTGIETAELIKYAANSFLATKIAFINEMADLCEKVGANIQEVSKGIGLDKRIGNKFLHPGPGYGGSCFPKDTLALVRIAEDAGVNNRIVRTVIAANEDRKVQMTGRIKHACGGSVSGKTVAVLGLTFKPNTDDMRDSASLVIIPELLKQGAKVRAFDPQGMKEARHMLSSEVVYCKDAYEAMNDADVLVILTEWNEFRSLNMKRLGSLMKQPVIVDLRNIYRLDDMKREGITYYSVGRPSIS